MTTEIVKIKASDFGLEESKGEEITKGLSTILAEREVLQEEYNKCIVLEITEENIPMFKSLRLRIRDNRTKGIEVWHKNNKAYFLAGGNFVDAIKRKEIEENERMEERLLDAEKFFENQEKERLEKLRTDRLELLKPYTEIEPMALGHMEQDVFDNLLIGFKDAYEKRIAAEKKAEEDRLAAIEAERIRQEEIRLENERLKKEAEEKEKALAAERERIRKENEEKERLAEIERKTKAKRNEELKPYIIFIRDYSKMLSLDEKAYQKELVDIKRGAKEHYEFEAKEKAKADKERAELLAKAETERKEKERLEKEIADKKAADEKKLRDAELQKQAELKAREKAEKAAKLAPDKDKLLKFGQDLNNLARPEIKNIEAAAVMAQINGYLAKLDTYIVTEANKL